MKISKLKVHQAIKVDKEGFYLTNKDYQISLDGNLVRIYHERSDVEVFTPLMNVCYFEGTDEPQPTAPVKGSSKKKAAKSSR